MSIYDKRHIANSYMMNRAATIFTLNFTDIFCSFNPLAAKLFNLNFHPREVVSR